MTERRTACTSFMWQRPHVLSAMRRSAGLVKRTYSGLSWLIIPYADGGLAELLKTSLLRGRTWARLLSCWLPSPPWHSTHVSTTPGCISSIPAWHVSHELLDGAWG